MNDLGQGWFYQTQSDTLFIDEYANAVGINIENSNVSIDLDVKDTIRTSNIWSCYAVTNKLSLVNSNSSFNYHNTIYLNTLAVHQPLPNSGFSSNNKWWGNNFSNTNIDWNIRLRKNAPIHHSWVQADPLSNMIWVEKWGAVSALAGAISGGATAAISVSSIYLAPFTSPSGVKAFEKATDIAGASAGDDAYALGISVGKEWGVYSACLEGGKDGADAGRSAVQNSLTMGIENEDSSLLGDTEIDASGLGTTARLSAVLLSGTLPAW